MGLVAMLIFILVFAQMLTFESLVKLLHTDGVFFMFAGLSLASFIFIYFFVPETKGLSQKEKQELFWPGAEFGRKLRPGE